MPLNLRVSGEHLDGVLDGEEFDPADPALDLIVAWHVLDASMRDRRTRLSVEADERHRAAVWLKGRRAGLLHPNTNPTMTTARPTSRGSVPKVGLARAKCVEQSITESPTSRFT